MNAIGFKYKPSEKARSIGGGQEVCACLSSETHDAAVAFCYDGYNQRAYEEVLMTMRSAMTGTEGNDADPKVAYGINPQGGQMLPFDKETGETLAVHHGGGVMQSLGFKAGQSANGGLGDEREVSPTLSHQPSALEPTLAQSQFGDVAECLTHRTDSSPCADRGQNVVATCKDLSQMRHIVRRLTPTECERLMGLPDGYTIPTGLRRFFGADGEPSPELVAEFQRIFDTFGAIMAEYEHAKPPKPKTAKQVADWLKKISDPATCPDSPRYKGDGNGWATNQPRWILTRLLAAEGIDPFNG